jgi:hypothetical protein
MSDSSRDPAPTSDDDSTDLPFLATWPAVYAFVLGTFAVWVVLLVWLARAFS